MSTAVRPVAVGDVELAVLEAGVGGRPLLVVHGFTGAKEDYVDHCEALAAAGWHVAVPDLRGHGASQAPPEESAYSLAALARDVAALPPALGWGHHVLVGHSMGGMLVQLVALGSTDDLDALVLMGTSHGPVDVDRDLALASVTLVRDSGMDALADLLLQLGGGPLETPASRKLRETRAEWAAFGDRKLRASSPAMYAAMVPAMLDQPDRLTALASLRVPTLVVAGEQDATFLDDCRRMAQAIPGARLVVMAGAGHSPHHEVPAEWRTVVLGFLATLAV